MNDNSGTTRKEIWQSSLGRKPVLGFDGTSFAEREKFITKAMRFLKSPNSQFDRELISELITAVRLNDHTWPEGEPEQTISELVNSVVNAEDRPEENWRWFVTVLQAMLLEFAVRIEDGYTQFRSDADSLVETILDALKTDFENVTHHRPTTLAYRLALMLAANFSAIPSRKQRNVFINLLRNLVESPTKYSHPFLKDLILIYEKMDLEHLGDLWETAAASPSN